MDRLDADCLSIAKTVLSTVSLNRVTIPVGVKIEYVLPTAAFFDPNCRDDVIANRVQSNNISSEKMHKTFFSADVCLISFYW